MSANINTDEARREVIISYMKCMRNHAMELMGNVLDGCGEFTTNGVSSSCAACGCHRSFHKRVKIEQLVIGTRSCSPPQAREPGQDDTIQKEMKMDTNAKRMRTKISSEKKERLKQFANGIDWKLKNKDENEIMQFCLELEITKPILKNWVNNNRKRMMLEKQSMANQTPDEIDLQNQYS